MFFSDSDEKKNLRFLKISWDWYIGTSKKISREFTLPKWLSRDVCNIDVDVILAFHGGFKTDLIRDRSNPLEGLNDNEMFERYRFFHAIIFFIVDSLKDNQFTSRRNNPFAPFHQVLVSLRFYATVPFYINNRRYFDHVKKHSWQGR